MNIRKYDIVQVKFTGTIGSEQGGIRPAVVIQNNIGNMYSNTTIVIPMTCKLKNLNQPTHTLIKKNVDNGLEKDSIVLGEQIRVISNKRIVKKIGSLVDKIEQQAIRKIYFANFDD